MTNPISSNSFPAAPVFSLNPDLTPQLAFQTVVKQQQEFLEFHWAQLSVDVETSVHELRKGTKRLRALVVLMKGILRAECRRKALRDLRDFSRKLGSARESYVNLLTYTQLQDLPADDFRAECEQLLSTEYEQWRQLLLRDKTLAEAYASCWTTLDACSSMTDNHNSSYDPLLMKLRKSYRKSRETYLEVQDQDDPDELHEWRKRVKQLWYQLVLLRGQFGGHADRLILEVDELGGLLGTLHDYHTLQAALRAVSGQSECDSATVAQLAESTLLSVREKAIQFFDSEPAVWIQDLSAG